MNDLETGFDSYLEHDLHIVSENGKKIPFYVNMDKCSTCFSKHLEIKKRNENVYPRGRLSRLDAQEINLSGNPEYKR